VKRSAREVVLEKRRKVTRKEAEAVETRNVAPAEETVVTTSREAVGGAGPADVLEKEAATRMHVVVTETIVDLQGDQTLTPRRIADGRVQAKEASLEKDLRPRLRLKRGQDLQWLRVPDPR